MSAPKRIVTLTGALRKRSVSERAIGPVLSPKSSIRCAYLLFAAALCLTFASPAIHGQSTPAQTTPTPAPKDENPFPGDTPQAPSPQKPVPPPGQTTKPDAAPTKPTSDNPFPGEDENVPIIPVPGSNAAPGSNYGGDSRSTPRRDSDPDGDPVRTPDPPGHYADGTPSDDGFSSSRSGLKQLPAEDDNDGRPGKSTKNKTREQLVKEDVDVGTFYLEKKDWKGAQSRFQSAFALDSENSEAVWGLAEAERHLRLYKESAEHYKLFLSYDPDGKHGREARKALQEVEAANQ